MLENTVNRPFTLPSFFLQKMYGPLDEKSGVRFIYSHQLFDNREMFCSFVVKCNPTKFSPGCFWYIIDEGLTVSILCVWALRRV